MALRQYRSDLYETDSPKKKPNYQPYQSRKATEQWKEVLFFLNIACFSILTVCLTYVYLSLRVPTFLAFLLAIGSSRLFLSILKKRRKARRKTT